ncbi:hypothetical protein DFP72DRAFT_1102677 [Ephemerocybe angulata]|uniref:Uncharacterized protein n=1 Tax=Ephemerocybe angulata TaxID=980116 RepID=A0A8H6M825_9AGAR|nr:hypothetical protein DFP72DRAFT_1102677 [Tulosesus angulatus]
MRTSHPFIALLTALQVLAIAPPTFFAGQVARRGECDSLCDEGSNAFKACGTTSNPDLCSCTTDNYNLMQGCFECLILSAKGRQAALGSIDGESGGGTVEILEEKAQVEEKKFTDACAASGYTLTGAATGGTGTSSGSLSGSSATTVGSSSATLTSSTSSASTTAGTSSAPSTSVAGAKNAAARTSETVWIPPTLFPASSYDQVVIRTVPILSYSSAPPGGVRSSCHAICYNANYPAYIPLSLGACEHLVKGWWVIVSLGNVFAEAIFWICLSALFGGKKWAIYLLAFGFMNHGNAKYFGQHVLDMRPQKMPLGCIPLQHISDLREQRGYQVISIVASVTFATRYRRHNSSLLTIVKREGAMYYFSVGILQLFIGLRYSASSGIKDKYGVVTAIRRFLIPIFADRLLLRLRALRYTETDMVTKAMFDNSARRHFSRMPRSGVQEEERVINSLRNIRMNPIRTRKSAYVL